MTGSEGGTAALRRPGQVPVTTMELFFDLVYVLAVTRLTDLLVENLTPAGAVQALILLLPVWWAWTDTSWITNWFDPNRPEVRLMLLGLTLLSLVFSATLSDAFGPRGLWVGAAYATMQVGRTVFAVAMLGGEPALRRNFQRVLAWKATAGTLWVVGGLAHDEARIAIWVAAVAIEYVAAALGFYTPGLGRSTTEDWPIEGRHLAERHQFFILVALGESILITGTVFGRSPPDLARLAALVCAFATTAALWWSYFDRSAPLAGERIARVSDPGRRGRAAYTYWHLPMVAGIILTAVGDELVLGHPSGPTRWGMVITLLGGPALFLAGHTLFKLAIFDHLSTPRLAAIAALAALVPVGRLIPPLALSAASALVLAAVPAWESARTPRRKVEEEAERGT
ncbi:low temperature requirement protein A [Micromonospora sp. NPDC049559]|uniref:low temperature requirement protein A n=1 Tax=Micromonospora sp. NPDC049559 TaxID=3155923 RepID=UPI003429E938